MSDLISAMQANDLARFNRLLVTNGLPSFPNDYKLLCKTLLYGRSHMARLLVEYGCHLDVSTFRGNSPLHLAAYNEDCLELIEQMLHRGAIVSRVDPRGDTALHVAFDNDSVNDRLLDLLLLGHLYVSCSNESNDAGLTFLHIAASRPDMTFAQYLIERGNADVNCQVRSVAGSLYAGYTPLHMAVEHGRGDIVVMLLSYGANLHARDANGSTPIHLAMERRDIDMVELLFEYDMEGINRFNKYGLSYFMAACACRSQYLVGDYLGNGNSVVNVNDIVNRSPFYIFNGYTALQVAVECGRLDTVRLLLANGAQITITYHGHTLRRVAVKNEHYQVAELIHLHTQNYEEMDFELASGFNNEFRLFYKDWPIPGL